MKIFIVFFSMLGLLPLSNALSAEIEKATAYDEEAILVDMEEKLKDASSARLKDVFFIPQAEKGAYVMCGKVNSKNSFGAYSGYESFTGLKFDRNDGRHVYLVLRIGGISAKHCDNELKAFSDQ